MSFIEGTDRGQINLLPVCVDDHVAPEALVRVIDAFVGNLDRTKLGFSRTVAAATGHPGFHPSDMLRLYIWATLTRFGPHGTWSELAFGISKRSGSCASSPLTTVPSPPFDTTIQKPSSARAPPSSNSVERAG